MIQAAKKLSDLVIYINQQTDWAINKPALTARALLLSHPSLKTSE